MQEGYKMLGWDVFTKKVNMQLITLIGGRKIVCVALF